MTAPDSVHLAHYWEGNPGSDAMHCIGANGVEILTLIPWLRWGLPRLSMGLNFKMLFPYIKKYLFTVHHVPEINNIRLQDHDAHSRLQVKMVCEAT